LIGRHLASLKERRAERDDRRAERRRESDEDEGFSTSAKNSV